MRERLASALFGSVWGALIGGLLAWLLGVYSQTLGAATMSVNAQNWIAGSAILFAMLGLIFNVGIGGIVGSVLNAIFQLENAEDRAVAPSWLANTLLLIAVCFLVWAFMGNLT